MEIVKHIQSIALVDEFLVEQNIDLSSIETVGRGMLDPSYCVPGWSDDEHREGLSCSLEFVEVELRQLTKKSAEGGLYFKGNLASPWLVGCIRVRISSSSGVRQKQHNGICR